MRTADTKCINCVFFEPFRSMRGLSSEGGICRHSSSPCKVEADSFCARFELCPGRNPLLAWWHNMRLQHGTCRVLDAMGVGPESLEAAGQHGIREKSKHPSQGGWEGFTSAMAEEVIAECERVYGLKFWLKTEGR